MEEKNYNNLKEIILINSKNELEKYINKLSESELNYFLDNLLPKLIEEVSINQKNNINEHNIEKIVHLLSLDIDYNFNKINTVLKNNKVISKKPRYFNYLEIINDINCADVILNNIDKSLFYEDGSFTYKLNFIDALFSNKKNKDFIEYYYNKYSNEIFNNLERNTAKNHDKYKLNLDVKDKLYNKIFNNRFNFKFINNFLETLNYDNKKKFLNEFCKIYNFNDERTKKSIKKYSTENELLKFISHFDTHLFLFGVNTKNFVETYMYFNDNDKSYSKKKLDDDLIVKIESVFEITGKLNFKNFMSEQDEYAEKHINNIFLSVRPAFLNTKGYRNHLNYIFEKLSFGIRDISVDYKDFEDSINNLKPNLLKNINKETFFKNALETCLSLRDNQDIYEFFDKDNSDKNASDFTLIYFNEIKHVFKDNNVFDEKIKNGDLFSQIIENYNLLKKNKVSNFIPNVKKMDLLVCNTLKSSDFNFLKENDEKNYPLKIMEGVVNDFYNESNDIEEIKNKLNNRLNLIFNYKNESNENKLYAILKLINDLNDILEKRKHIQELDKICFEHINNYLFKKIILEFDNNFLKEKTDFLKNHLKFSVLDNIRYLETLQSTINQNDTKDMYVNIKLLKSIFFGKDKKNKNIKI